MCVIFCSRSVGYRTLVEDHTFVVVLGGKVKNEDRAFPGAMSELSRLMFSQLSFLGSLVFS